jgi:hypothetical protein
MKSKTLLWILAVLLSILPFYSCKHDDPVNPEYTTLKQALLDIESISMIEADPDTAAVRKKKKGEWNYKEQYSMLFKQDLDHSDEGGDSFQQRVCILFRGFDRPTILVTEGYDWAGFGDGEDLGINLNANIVHVEHRNFGKSFNQDNKKWQFQTGEQSSADLHEVYLTLKPLFKGKWMSTGTSKSGETSILYAYYYPQDMDLAAAFCSPFMTSCNDERFGPYLFEQAGTEKERELMKTGIRIALQGGEEGMYKTFSAQMKASHKWTPPFTEYVFNLFDTYFQVFQYKTQKTGRSERLEQLAADKDKLVKAIVSTNVDNKDVAFRSYPVECAKELGWPNDGYSYFANELAGTSFKEADVLTYDLQEEDRWVIGSYDGTLYHDIVNNFFVNTTCPLLLFYSQDDPWTAGKPDKVGPNVKIVINPIGRHSDNLNDTDLCPPQTKQEVMDYVSTYIY